MTQEEYDKLVEQSQPHKKFKTSWGYYKSNEFRETFLPYSPYKSTEKLIVSDGANLFKRLKIQEAELSLSNNNEIPSIIYYTYPKTVLASQKKKLILPNSNEIICFVEVNKNDKIELFFNYGKTFDAFLKRLAIVRSNLHNSTIEEFQKQFYNTISHEQAFSFILNTMGVENQIINDLNQSKGLSQSMIKYFNSILIDDKFKIRVIPRSSTTQIGIETGELDSKTSRFRHVEEITPEPNEIIIWLLTENFQVYDTSFIKIKIGNLVAKDLKEKNISIQYLENIILTQVSLEIDQNIYSKEDISGALDKGMGNALVALNIKSLLDQDPVLQEVFKKDPFLGLIAIAAKEGAKKLEDYEIGAESWDPKHPNFSQFIPGDSKNNAFICGLINGIIGEAKSVPEMIEFLITVVNSEKASKEFEASIKKLLEEGIIKTLIEASLKEYAEAFKENNFEKLYYNVGKDITQIISLFIGVYQLASSIPKFAKVAKNAILYLQKYGRKGIKKLKSLSKKRKLEILDEMDELAGFAKNIGLTSDPKKIKEFQEGLRKLSRVTQKDAYDNIYDALKYFNRKVEGNRIIQISDTNCVNVVQVVDEYLKTGKIRLANHSKPQTIDVLTNKYGGDFKRKTIKQLKLDMKENEMGIIFGNRGTGKTGHVFNVIMKDGYLRMFDGQSGTLAKIDHRYVSLHYLKTN